MGWFKRLCLFVFGLAGILALVALCLPWVGPYTQEAADLIHVSDYFVALEVLVCITALGCLVCLLRALFTPRNRKEIIVSSEGGDQITVTRAAIASQAEHIVERDGTCVAGTVRVNARKRGSVKVFVRVTPKRSLNVVEKGEQLQAALDEGLAQIAADKIKSVRLEFTDPQEMDVDVSVPATSPSASLATDDSYGYDASYGDDATTSLDASDDVVPDGEPEPVTEASPAVADDGESGITVSMSSFRAAEPDADTEDGEE